MDNLCIVCDKPVGDVEWIANAQEFLWVCQDCKEGGNMYVIKIDKPGDKPGDKAEGA